MSPRLHRFLHTLSKPAVAIGGSLAIALVVVGSTWHLSRNSLSGTYSATRIAPITGRAGAVSDLSFETAGRVVAVQAMLGAPVAAGATLIVLDHATLTAQLAGALANLEAMQAKLAALVAGTRPEQISINQTAVIQGKDVLRNTLRTAYVLSDTAIHTTVDQSFTNPRSTNASFTIVVPDSTLVNTINAERVALEPQLATWGAIINASGFSTSDPSAAVDVSKNNLIAIGAFLNAIARALSETQPTAALQAYQAGVDAARSSNAGALAALTTAETALKSAEGALTLAHAGATENDIAQAQAAVDAAKAAVLGINVAISKTVLTAPISGTISAVNAELGDTVSPGIILVSIDSTGGEKQSALVVPSSAVISENGSSFVYRKSAGAPVKTPVTTGLVGTDGQTEIVSGLSVGDEVLTFGITK